MPQDWTMPRRGERCAVCQREFAAGDSLSAFLYETPAGYERRDCCPVCTPPEDPALVGTWKTRRPEPSATAQRAAAAIDKAALLSVFEQMADTSNPRQIQFRFVLALLLWRKRVLKLDATRDVGGVETWDFVNTRSGTVHGVVRPELDESELDRLSNELEALIAGGGNGDFLAPASTPAEGGE